jgi:hypothetical protein
MEKYSEKSGSPEDLYDFVENSAYIFGGQSGPYVSASSSKSSKNCGGSKSSRSSKGGAVGGYTGESGLAFLVKDIL